MDAENDSDILGSKKLNYQFLLLVRDKKYQQALLVGKKILATDPNNPSVKKFCDFIIANDKKLQKMLQQQKQQEQYQSVNSDDEEQEQQQGEENQNKQQSSSDQDDNKSGEQDQQQEQEEQPKEQKEQKPKPKLQLRTCTLNQIPHICTRDHN